VTLRRLALAAAFVTLGRMLPAQGWQSRSVVGAAAVTLDATFGRLTNAIPLQTTLIVNAGYAPFISQHWQIAFAPAFGMNSSDLGRFVSGTAGVAADYFPGNADVSSPFVGAFFSTNAASHEPGYVAWGVQAGWLRFLSPELALRTELRYRRYETAQAVHQSDVFVTFDSYLFGRARPSPRALPGLGTVDISALADLLFEPNQNLTMNLTAAPFLTRWLQAGGLSDFLFLFDENVSQHYVEGFVRGYLPLGTRAAPFAELYTSRENLQFGTTTRGSHGARLGLRSYLAPGVALDVGWEWRNFGDLEPERRQLRIRLAQQIRVGFGG
jgi:hypothetical protein